MKNFLQDQNADLEGQVQKRTAELKATLDVTIHVMAYMVESRVSVTGNHIYRTQHYIKTLAEQLRFHPRFESFLNNNNVIKLLFKTALFYDIGSVGIPDRIFLKPGRLTPDEFEIMKSHTSRGRNFILYAERDLGIEVPFYKYAKEIVYSHHEKWDGSGYPEGLAGDAIPISARLMSIADVYDALISRRVYKSPVPHEQAVKIILEGKGTQFDSDIVDSFYKVHKEFQHIAQAYADNNEDFNKRLDYLEQAIGVAP
jgi:putative two-component system response regulator